MVFNVRVGGLSLGLLLAVLSIGLPAPAIAEHCGNHPFGTIPQSRCVTHQSNPVIADSTPSGASRSLAVFTGPPKDGVACNGSLTVGDNVGWYRNGTPGTITDINLIAQSSRKLRPFDHHVTDMVTAGWLYRDERGNYWVQQNARVLPEISPKTRSFFASLGLPDSGGTHVVTTGRRPPDVRSAHLDVFRCWSDGKQFAS